MKGNEKLYATILKKFCDNQADSMKLLIDAFDSGDLHLTSRTTHTLKGVAATIGAGPLSGLAARLEDGLARGESRAALWPTLDATSLALDNLVAALRAHLTAHDAAC